MRHPDTLQKLAIAAFIVTSTLLIIAGTAWGVRLFAASHNQATTQQANQGIGGFPMGGNLAPDFNLTDQFGHAATLSSFRGREVVLAFIDARCTTLCPLTAQIMYNARVQLGSTAANRIALVAVNANPDATSIATVQAWSINHGMLHQWSFLTGTAKQLQSVYRQYQIYEQVNSDGSAVHDPATFIIDTNGHERLYFETLDSSAKPDLNDQEIGLEAGMRQWLPQ
jgi:cytochrome oxidase Cu insertion factor (SCO1/SenC/PrrC family)